MLDAIKKKGGKIKPTHLLYRANLSHDALQRYLAELMAAGFVTEEMTNSRKQDVLQEAGHHFLAKYSTFKKLSNAVGIYQNLNTRLSAP